MNMIVRPKVSVIIATHNNVDTVENCIDSIWSREFADVEVVVVDVNSTDGTKDLLAQMEVITEYGNAAFHTVDVNNGTADGYARGYYHNKFDSASGVLFLIDMDNRKVYIFSDGNIYKTVTKSYANVITDNVYQYATNADYYTCASEVFSQVYDLLEGRRIAQPMKYVSNILLAVVFALLINYMMVRGFARAKTPSREEILTGLFVDKKLTDTRAEFVCETRKYDPVSSGSSGSSGGGGGGGGSSGGGGGHSF